MATQIGFVRADSVGLSVPIYSVNELTMARSQRWEQTDIPTTASSALFWAGNGETTLPIDFELCVGFGIVESRQMLKRLISSFQAMASHQFGAGTPSSSFGGLGLQFALTNVVATPPPLVTYHINGMIHMKGVLQSAKCTMTGPWSLIGGMMVGLKCHFSGNFIPAPGYDGSLLNIVDNVKPLASSTIAARLYEL